MNAAPAAGWTQYLDALVKRGAVKADEIEWTGLREWLGLQQGKVTREAGPMKHGTTVIAFVEDPDGYKIEFIEKGSM